MCTEKGCARRKCGNSSSLGKISGQDLLVSIQSGVRHISQVKNLQRSYLLAFFTSTAESFKLEGMAATVPSSVSKTHALILHSSSLREHHFPDSRIICPRSRKARFPHLNGMLKRATNASVFPVIRAQSSQEYTPEAKFYKIEAILRPWRVPHVSLGLLKMGIRGVTVSDVRGFGAQGGSTERQAGSEFSEDKFVAKVKMEIVVSRDQVDAVIDKIIEEARTGEIGDGKIFLIPVSDVIRVRTGERGEMAERMTGGLSDILSSAVSN